LEQKAVRKKEVDISPFVRGGGEATGHVSKQQERKSHYRKGIVGYLYRQENLSAEWLKKEKKQSPLGKGRYSGSVFSSSSL